MKIHNQFLISQCIYLNDILKRFLDGLEMAAMQDDGIISREERKFVNSLTRKVNRLIAALDKATR